MKADWKTQQSKDAISSPKYIYRLNTIPVKISARFSVDINIILKLIWKDKGILEIAKTTLKKKNKNKVGGISLSDFRTYSTATLRLCGIGTDKRINGIE